jgi:hypothetical protein
MMSLEPLLRQRRAEKAAFDTQLPALLDRHLGKWTVFAHRRPLGFFGSYSEAFAHGLALFGVDRVFLVARVQDPPWKLLGLRVAKLLSAA